MIRKAGPFRLFMGVLVAILAASIVITSTMGAIGVSLQDAYAVLMHHLFGMPLPEALAAGGPVEKVVWSLRFPRIILGVVAGAGLALAGVVMQASVQNTLAEPYILGISSGASCGATCAIMLGAGAVHVVGISSVPLFSFIGSTIATIGVLLLASTGGHMTSSKLVLSGMILNALFTALSNFIITIAANAEGMMDLKFWTMGSLARASWGNVGISVVVVLLVSVFFLNAVPFTQRAFNGRRGCYNAWPQHQSVQVGILDHFCPHGWHAGFISGNHRFCWPYHSAYCALVCWVRSPKAGANSAGTGSYFYSLGRCLCSYRPRQYRSSYWHSDRCSWCAVLCLHHGCPQLQL